MIDFEIFPTGTRAAIKKLLDKLNGEISGIKNCPFCGGETRLNYHGGSDQHWVSCPKCYFEGFMPIIGKEYALKTWKTRATDTEATALAELIKMVK